MRLPYGIWKPCYIKIETTWCEYDMNLVQCFILDIHSEEDVTSYCKWATENMIEVDITTNCYGIIERKKEVFSQSAWDGAKEKGWYLG